MKQIWTAEKRKKSEHVNLFRKMKESRKKYRHHSQEKKAEKQLWTEEERQKLEDLKDILDGVFGLQYLYFSQRARRMNCDPLLLLF